MNNLYIAEEAYEHSADQQIDIRDESIENVDDADQQVFSPVANKSIERFDTMIISGMCGAGLKWSFHEKKGNLIISGSGEMDSYTNEELLAG